MKIDQSTATRNLRSPNIKTRKKALQILHSLKKNHK
ncbi:putative metal homeostasis protein [Furfurilactobacillus rossiae]|nr:putative metal homeostasis protein [Furfurilactobacillus rossiae]MCF6165476.1 putative metal homeostasis protein [Furfurilactobacillus rossiae]